jgi:hypothetical protein
MIGAVWAERARARDSCPELYPIAAMRRSTLDGKFESPPAAKVISPNFTGPDPRGGSAVGSVFAAEKRGASPPDF